MDRQKLESAKAVITEWKDTCEKFPKNSEASKHYQFIAEVHKVSIECIDKALSQPERKHGHIEYNERTGTFECSVCKACWYLITPPKHKYCPECGAKMDEVSDGTRD